MTIDVATAVSLHRDIVMNSEPFGVRAEAIRALRTHLLAQHLAGGRRALAVCGPTAGVGVSFVAANLAVALSQVGVNTLLVDANLREPGLERLIRPPGPPVGLAQKLADNTPYDEFVDARVMPN